MGALELAKILWVAYNAHKPGDAGELYTADGTHTDAALSRQAIGGQDISRGLAYFLHCFPDAHWTACEWIGDGAVSAISYRLTGTLSAPMGPFEPAGQRLDLRGVLVVHAGDGGIVATEDYWDRAAFHEQMNPG
jgi:hypothetical protein